MTASDSAGVPGGRALQPYDRSQGANLADILERVLDKGIVIVGDIRINLLDIELLTVKLRLLVASVDKAREIGIDWWEHDPALSSRADAHDRRELEEENKRLLAEVRALRERPSARSELPEGAAARRRRPASSAREREREPERRRAPEPERRRERDRDPDQDPERDRDRDRDRERRD
ncbi:gas vesicle protein [Streptomyces exfoliatus]|uniref:gas vesicle protein n=1 Tax=Streptomyces exfoliatus TaxID=1905 RepID=UPI003C2D6673